MTSGNLSCLSYSFHEIFSLAENTLDVIPTNSARNLVFFCKGIKITYTVYDIKAHL